MFSANVMGAMTMVDDTATMMTRPWLVFGTMVVGAMTTVGHTTVMMTRPWLTIEAAKEEAEVVEATAWKKWEMTSVTMQEAGGHGCSHGTVGVHGGSGMPQLKVE